MSGSSDLRMDTTPETYSCLLSKTTKVDPFFHSSRGRGAATAVA